MPKILHQALDQTPFLTIFFLFQNLEISPLKKADFDQELTFFLPSEMLEPSQNSVGISGALKCRNSRSLCVGKVGARLPRYIAVEPCSTPQCENAALFNAERIHQKTVFRLRVVEMT